MLTPQTIVFFILAAVATISALLVVTNVNPVRSALSLVITFLSVALLYITLSAQFVAAVQIIVYAGAIMVLFLFVIMLLNLGAPAQPEPKGKAQPRAALLLSGVFIGALALSPLANLAIEPKPEAMTKNLGTVSTIGATLYNPSLQWLFPFEATSILLLVAVVGAIVLAKRRI
jgi:NADH-quinone oxidoreductase subunit J